MNDTKKILVTVTGMSPQIITETLYALTQEKQWIPDEIHVLTTLTGAQKIEKSLLGKNKFFAQFCEEFKLHSITFNEKNIHIIKNEDGQLLDDIRTPEQNSAAADKIIKFIYDLCNTENNEIHVSIAGGRKSMGFYIGYALSLFGRPQDKLSHVLVEEDFENLPDFYYPTKTISTLTTRNGPKDPSKAKVMLADIPFVRIRQGLPKLELKDNWNFSSAVNLTQNDLNNFELTIDPNTRTIQFHNFEPIKFQQRIFCTYWAMALIKLKEGISIRRNNDDDLLIFKNYFNQCKFSIDPAYKVAGANARSNREHDQKIKLEDYGIALQEDISRIKKEIKKLLGDYGSIIYIQNQKSNKKTFYTLATPTDKIKILPLKD